MPKIIPPPRGFIWTDVYFLSAVAALCFCNAVILALSNLEQEQHSLKPVIVYTYWHSISPIHLHYHMHLDFIFPDKSNTFYPQTEERFLNVSVSQSTACKVTVSQACHKRGISLKPRSKAKRRSETQQQPISYAPIINYSTFSLWKISNSRAY